MQNVGGVLFTKNQQRKIILDFVQKYIMEFKPFDSYAKERLTILLTGKNYVGSEFSYHGFLSWFDNLEYAETDNAFYMRALFEDGDMYWPPIIIEGTAEDALKAIEGNKIYFVSDEFASSVYGKYHLHSERKWAEYIYLAKDFIALDGKRYHAKRNHIKKFQKLYNSTIEPYKAEDKVAVEQFEKAWLETKNFDEKERQSAENEQEIVRGWYEASLRGELVCDVLKVDGKVVGVSIGEIMPSGNAVVIYEKGDTNYEGVYSYLANTFAKRNFSQCEYINRQEDMGIEGLRKSKLSYYPAFLYTRFVMTPLTCNRVLKEQCPLTPYRVRKLDTADYDVAMAFFEEGRRALQDVKHFLNYTEEELRQVLEHGFMLGVFDGETLISTCAVDSDKEYGEKLREICGEARPVNFYEFSGIMTAVTAQRKGISRALCGEVIEYAKDNLSPCVLCAVVQYDNLPSLNNLTNLGFVERGRATYGEYDFRYLCLEI
jgi:GNAT superfamily N-acetyltransferase